MDGAYLSDWLGRRIGVFRVSLTSLWRLSGVLVLVLLPMVITRIARADDISVAMVALALASLLLVPLLVFGFLAPFVWLFRVQVFELGLRAHDAYGRPLPVRFTSMVAVDTVDLLGLGYLRITTSDPSRTVYLPSSLVDAFGFERLLTEHADPTNPLVLHFRARHAG